MNTWNLSVQWGLTVCEANISHHVDRNLNISPAALCSERCSLFVQTVPSFNTCYLSFVMRWCLNPLWTDCRWFGSPVCRWCRDWPLMEEGRQIRAFLSQPITAWRLSHSVSLDCVFFASPLHSSGETVFILDLLETWSPLILFSLTFYSPGVCRSIFQFDYLWRGILFIGLLSSICSWHWASSLDLHVYGLYLYVGWSVCILLPEPPRLNMSHVQIGRCTSWFLSFKPANQVMTDMETNSQ